MNHLSQVTLYFSDATQMFCPLPVVRRSKLLQDMIYFSEQDNGNGIIVPDFISKTIISDLEAMLERNHLECLLHVNIKYFIDMVEAADFFLLIDLTENLMETLSKRITFSNSFEVFQLSRKKTLFYKITHKAISLIMSRIENYYKYENFDENAADPFVSTYKKLKINDIQDLLICSKTYSPVAKIQLFKNWWLHNVDLKLKPTVLLILEIINEDASYFHRQLIRNMRAIRDKIKRHLLELEN